MLVHAPRLAAVRACTAIRIAPLVAIAIVAIQAAHLPYLEAWPTAHNDEARELIYGMPYDEWRAKPGAPGRSERVQVAFEPCN